MSDAREARRLAHSELPPSAIGLQWSSGRAGERASVRSERVQCTVHSVQCTVRRRSVCTDNSMRLESRAHVHPYRPVDAAASDSAEKFILFPFVAAAEVFASERILRALAQIALSGALAPSASGRADESTSRRADGPTTACRPRDRLTQFRRDTAARRQLTSAAALAATITNKSMDLRVRILPAPTLTSLRDGAPRCQTETRH